MYKADDRFDERGGRDTIVSLVLKSLANTTAEEFEMSESDQSIIYKVLENTDVKKFLEYNEIDIADKGICITIAEGKIKAA